MEKIEKIKEKSYYTAAFVKDIEWLKNKYPQDKEKYLNSYYHHITYEYKPDDLENGIKKGFEKIIKIIGRVRTEKVDALLVDDPKSLNEFPHITLSTAEGVAPFESNVEIEKAIENRTIEKIDDEITIIEGYFDGENDVVSDKEE